MKLFFNLGLHRNSKIILPANMTKFDDYYVYVYTREGNVPFYVGKGKKYRWREHLKEAISTKKNSHKLNIIRKLLDKEQTPSIYKIATNLSEKEAYEIESKLIEFFNSHKKTLTNILDNKNGHHGGDSITNHPNRAKIIAKNKHRIKKGQFAGSKNFCFGKFGKNHPAFGNKKSKEGIENIRLAIISHIKSTGGRAKEKNHRFGDHRNYEELHGKEKAKQLKQKQSQQRQGENNNRAKTWKLISPTNEEFIIKGTLERFCEEKELSIVALKRYINSPVILNPYFRKTSKKLNNTLGWRLYEL